MRCLLFILSFFASLHLEAQVAGCTDPLANNYNPAATLNNGSCQYSPASVAPESSAILSTAVQETSGLITFGDFLLTHNDSNDTSLYALDRNTGAIVQQYNVPGLTNTDWEEITQDDLYLYIGDFGNNQHGNRQNLKVIRILKSSLGTETPIVESIFFSYEDQTNFSALAGNSTDFDCEAFIAADDFLYLFTKQWASQATAIYKLSKEPGSHVASFEGTWNTQGLITGATYNQTQRIVSLSGYNNMLQPFLLLLYDFEGNDFFSGNKRKIALNLQFHQVESIASEDWLHYYVSNEKLTQQFLNIPPKLHRIDLTSHLNLYLSSPQLNADDQHFSRQVNVFPNPVAKILTVSVRPIFIGSPYVLYDNLGRIVAKGAIISDTNYIDVSGLSRGEYHLQIGHLINNTINIVVE